VDLARNMLCLPAVDQTVDKVQWQAFVMTDRDEPLGPITAGNFLTTG
jgi:hypothetical protein